MADIDPFDLSADPDVDAVDEPGAEAEISSVAKKKNKRKLSPMYEKWGFYVAGQRDSSHKVLSV